MGAIFNCDFTGPAASLPHFWERTIGSDHAPIQRIDPNHANAKMRWQKIDAPEYLNSKVIAELHAASHLRDEAQACRFQDGVVELDVVMPPLGVAAVTLLSVGRNRG